MNLQEPGEHSLCGDGIDDKIGFSYDGDVFNNVGIAYFNFFWQDLTCPKIQKTLMICQVLERFDQKGKRIFVHCHAGTGRTALIIAAYLFYSGMCKTASEAVSVVQKQRQGALQRKAQVLFVIEFAKWLSETRQSLYPLSNSKEQSALSYQQMMQR